MNEITDNQQIISVHDLAEGAYIKWDNQTWRVDSNVGDASHRDLLITNVLGEHKAIACGSRTKYILSEPFDLVLGCDYCGDQFDSMANAYTHGTNSDSMCEVSHFYIGPKVDIQ